MSWRGSTRPTSASTSHTSSSSDNVNNTSKSTFNNFTSNFEGSADRGRGRGRGGSRGTGRGNVRGGANLSWRKPAKGTEAPTHGDNGQGGADAAGAAAVKSAFAAFGDPSSFSSAGSTSNGGGFGAFGAGGNTGGSAFGSSTFGAGGGSAFGAGGGSAFSTSASSSSFSPTPTSTSALPSSFATSSQKTPLFLPPSDIEEGAEEEDEGGEEEEEDEQDEGNGGGADGDAKRAPGQISTLEVLGEDSDARKKRFEASLPNNRYLELKPLREAQRVAAIKSGLIPDPSKPMRLDQATDFQGTCEEMCPEWEREEREYQNNVDPLERYPGTTRIDPSRAVKAFHRPAAGNDAPLPSDVRPPAILSSTLDYLFHILLPLHPLATTHPFLRDRTRSVRQDFTVQNVRGGSAVEAHERIARYHILALGVLREQSGFSESQELEQLRKVLKSLNEFYDDARLSSLSSSDPSASSFPNEAEFRAYNLLTHLRDPDIIWSTELLPPAVFSHPLLQTALRLHRLAQKSNLPRGERASLNASSRFFKAVSGPSVPFLFACILSTHFGEVRRNAIEVLKAAFLKQHSAYPLRSLAKILGCDGEEARDICRQLGVGVVRDEKGREGAEVHKGAVLKAVTLKPHVSQRLVEAKRGQTSYSDIIDGKFSSIAFAVTPLPQTPAPVQGASPFGPSSRAQPLPSPVPSPFPSHLATSAAAQRPSPVPTPVPTPPLGKSPLAPAQIGAGLNATAAAFVPSFGGLGAPAVPVSTVPPALPAASGFSFAPVASSAPAAPSPTAFSFASSAPAPPPPSFSVAATSAPSAPLPTAAPPLTSADLLRPTKPLRPSSLRTTVTASPFIPSSLATSPVPPPASIPHSSSVAAPLLSPRVPPSLSPTSAFNNPTGRRRVSSSTTINNHLLAAATARRAALVSNLAHQLTNEILTEVIGGPVRRAAAEVLRERWAGVARKEREGKERLAKEVAGGLRGEMERLLIAEGVVREVRDERERRRILKEWVRRQERKVEDRVEREERRRRKEEVLRGLEGARRVRMETENAYEGDEDEVVEREEEEDEGFAGGEDVEFDFEGLSLAGAGGQAGNEEKVRAEQRDNDMAEQVRQAAASRDQIWRRGTFLNLLLARLSESLSAQYLSFRPTWTAVLALEDRKAPFSNWLRCKFDLDEEGNAEADTPHTEVKIRMVGKEDENLTEDEYPSTGLIVFDCTKQRGEDYDWTSARSRLSALLARITSSSLFSPALLVVLCPDRTLSPKDEGALRTKVANDLNLSALTGISSSSVYIAHIEYAEAEFAKEAHALLQTVAVRKERVPRGLNRYIAPLVSTWLDSVAKTYASLQSTEEAAPTFASLFLQELQAIVDETEQVAKPRLPSFLVLPPLPHNASSFHSSVSSYIAQPAFAFAGYFPNIATTLAQRPPLADLPLARLLLDHLSDFVLSSFSTTSGAAMSTTQGVLDTLLPPSLETLRNSLAKAEAAVNRLVLQGKKERSSSISPFEHDGTGNANVNGKKRRASTAPEAAEVSPKKPSISVTNSALLSVVGAGLGEEDCEKVDRLGALEKLLRETRGLLAA
ncbi:hypothetical protein JCM11641_004873 [Rhodosporidiobolus odoratus]